MLKKTLSIVVLIIFLAHFAGFYIYFIVQLQLVRTEMRAKLKELPAEELELIILSPAAYEEAKVEEHEMKIAGNMYDIARVLESNDSIHIYCIHDKAEDNLLAFFDKMLSLPLKDSSVPLGILQFMSLSYLQAQWNFLIPEFQHAQFFPHYTEMLSYFNATIVTPPPRIG